MSDVDAYIAKAKQAVKEARSKAKQGDWYEDITRTEYNEETGVTTIYRSWRRVVLDDDGEVIRTKSGAPKRETHPTRKVLPERIKEQALA